MDSRNYLAVLVLLVIGSAVYFVANQAESVSIPPSDRSISITSFLTPRGSSGTFFFNGYYDFGATDNDFSPSITFGSSNSSYASHFFVVTGAVPVDEVTISVTGIAVYDNGTAFPNHTETITIPTGTPINSYFETDKFIGQVTVETTAGTPITANYGWSKYFDNQNKDFVLEGVEALWLGAANDPNFDMKIIHHNSTNWTFNSGAPPTYNNIIASLREDQINSGGVTNGDDGAWKHVNINQFINGSGMEGILIEVDSSVNSAIDIGTVKVYIRGT